MESAYPGFGERVYQSDSDHILSCKPRDTRDPAYARTLDLIRGVLEAARRSDGGGGSGGGAEEGGSAGAERGISEGRS